MKKIFKNIWFVSLLAFSPVVCSQNNPELNRLIATALANNKELSSYQLQTHRPLRRISIQPSILIKRLFITDMMKIMSHPMTRH